MKIARSQTIAKLGRSIAGNAATRRLFSAAAVVALGTLLVKVASVGKELVVAYVFGTAAELDAFLIALMIPSLILAIIAGSFNSALIPTYIKVRERQGSVAAQKLFAGTTFWSIGLLILTTVLMLATAPLYLPILCKGFSPEKVTLTYQLLWVVSPMLLISGICTSWAAVLNAGERFALVALAPMLTSISTVILLLGFKSWGIFNLSLGMTIGQLLETIVLGVVLHKQGISVVPKWHGVNKDLIEVASQYAPSMVGAFLMCSTGLVDQAMAAMLPSGSVAALGYGNRIVTLPVIIASTAVSTVVMPYFSKLVADRDWSSVRHSLKHYLTLIFAASIPLTIVLILFSEPLVVALLQRGSFNAKDAHLVADIQTCFAFQIPFYIGCMLVVRVISAMRSNHILMWGSAGNLLVNIVLNYVFMQWLGIAGIALSTSCVYAFSFAFLVFATLQQLNLTPDLILSPEQKQQMRQLRQDKRQLTAEILTDEQFQHLERSKSSAASIGSSRLNLSEAQRQELSLIHQNNIDRFRALLTPAQRAKIDRLQQAAMSKIEKVLTVEQLRRLKAMKNPKRPSTKDWNELNLSANQKVRIRDIRRHYERQVR
jgi:putative peptidoglycan lipid II flippase